METHHVLVTGAGGFIGSHLVQAFLRQADCTVLALSRKARPPGLPQARLLWKQGDVLNPAFLEETFSSLPIRSVIHLAALRGAGSGDARAYHAVNVEGTERLLDLSWKHAVNTFVFCSSVGVHGSIPAELPATWKSPFHADSLYHQSKISAEKIVERYIRRGLNAYIVRPTITYGAGDTGFPKTLIDVVRKRRLLLPSDDILIHLLSAGKLAELIRTMLFKTRQKELRTFIVADAEPISLKRLADLIHQHYYGVDYPALFSIPNVVFNGLEIAFRMMRNEKWRTRILLLSKSWYYDIQDTIRLCSYRPAETAQSFLKEMRV
ncbi:hypothetical protein CSB45_04365 [candidate division KSB3 bacterium]|uniref:NAD-dependent epimerase/dehydratase domain-containing protein n=1 Tax=candidate division KSB3 bacterium TaxID=2044937 RepID=A0A2G6E884_9BACT|nr:MAG: hypothetical protein CSB45_04365 [candidate division KSB3 bacterium]PIE30611.1 MAG: hypothetical protein CSA57_02950 [candidate division KSB3 bacterium]